MKHLRSSYANSWRSNRERKNQQHCSVLFQCCKLQMSKWKCCKKILSLNELINSTNGHRISVNPFDAEVMVIRSFNKNLEFCQKCISNIHSITTILISDYVQFNHAPHFNHPLKSHIIISEINWMSIDAPPNMWIPSKWEDHKWCKRDNWIPWLFHHDTTSSYRHNMFGSRTIN